MDVLQIILDCLVDLGRIDKDGCAVESDEQVSMEKGVVRYVCSSEVESVGWMSMSARKQGAELLNPSPICGSDMIRVPTCLCAGPGSPFEYAGIEAGCDLIHSRILSILEVALRPEMVISVLSTEENTCDEPVYSIGWR